MIRLPFVGNPLARYRQLAGLQSPVLLDSGGEQGGGRWDIIAAQPDRERSLRLDADATPAQTNRGLERLRVAMPLPRERDNPQGPDLPFRGGYIGALGYELGRRLHGLPPRTGGLPLAMVNYYPWAIVQDRERREAWLVGDCPAMLADALVAAAASEEPLARDQPFSLRTSFRHPWDQRAYGDVFDRVKAYITAGDCYQINIGQPFTARYTGALTGAYAILRDIARAPYSAYFPLDDDHHLLCLSPERFLLVDRDRVETRPIKGTRPRQQDPGADAEAARELLASSKERAENLMIVDLLRNDIGRFCRAGSVRAEALFRLESYATVHHLVSVVQGQLSPGLSPLELLLGCLPGGSITGAPKRRAMQIIDELEAAPRQAWCGSIFYLSRHGRMDSNITIRTLYSEGDRLTCWAGGGLVDDSETTAEYQEQRDKVGAFLAALEATA